MSPTDESLLAQIAAENNDAFASFYDRHAPKLLGLLLKILGNVAEAEDALQETFWQVWTRARDYDAQRASAVVWLVMIARSRATDQLRRRKRETVELEAELVGAVVQDDALARDEDARIARGALSHLSEDERRVICLAYYGGLTHEQIAAHEKLPLGTVKTRIRTGIRRMRDLLAEAKAVAS